MTFKVGDRVKCVADVNSHGCLKTGNIYTVVEAGDYLYKYIRLRAVSSEVKWDVKRFELVKGGEETRKGYPFMISI